MKIETRLWRAEIRYSKEAQKLGHILGDMAALQDDQDGRQLFLRMKDIREMASTLQCVLITLAQDVTRYNHKEPTEEEKPNDV